MNSCQEVNFKSLRRICVCFSSDSSPENNPLNITSCEPSHMILKGPKAIGRRSHFHSCIRIEPCFNVQHSALTIHPLTLPPLRMSHTGSEHQSPAENTSPSLPHTFRPVSVSSAACRHHCRPESSAQGTASPSWSAHLGDSGPGSARHSAFEHHSVSRK